MRSGPCSSQGKDLLYGVVVLLVLYDIILLRLLGFPVGLMLLLLLSLGPSSIRLDALEVFAVWLVPFFFLLPISRISLPIFFSIFSYHDGFLSFFKRKKVNHFLSRPLGSGRFASTVIKVSNLPWSGSAT